MSTVPADSSGQSDAELITSVRRGELTAYGTLYERHVRAAYNLARQLVRSPAEADDLVSEAFAKVLDTLRGGKGPDRAFRAYLLTALRHTAYDKTRRDRRVDLNEDMTEVGGAAGDALTVPFSDTAVAGLERTLAARAFARLPERWQAVLWHTEIEQQSPAEVAPLLGLTPNGVSALAYRAREGLRQAYLQVHLAETAATRCRATAERLGAWTRDGLAKRERAQVEAHLDECDRCRALAAELADVNGSLRAVVAPLVLGGAALGYLAAVGATKASAATAGAAAVGAGTAAGAAGASGASGGGGVATAGPRQFLGVAASGVALAAAIAVGLAAGGGGQDVPAAAERPASRVHAPEPVAPPVPPAPQPPAPPAPEPPAPPPAPPPAEPAPPPVPPPAPPEQPPAQEPPAEQPPPPDQPEPARLTAERPSADIELVPDGDPVELPITVRNDGGSESEPVEATLTLPPGVTATGPGHRMAGPAPLRLNAAQPGTPRVDCPGGEGRTVTCTSPEGLEPGESVVLVFRLVAGENASGGQVTGTVSAGAEVRISVSVPVAVRALRDEVALRVEEEKNWPWALPWSRWSVFKVVARNTGESTKPITVEIDMRGQVTSDWWAVRCDSGRTLSCTSREAVEPGKELRLSVLLHRGLADDTATVTARLGSDIATRSATVPCAFPCRWPDRPTPTPEPSISPDRAPSSPDVPGGRRPGKGTGPKDTEPAPSTPAEPHLPLPVLPSPSPPPSPPPTSTSAPDGGPRIDLPLPWDWWPRIG
ncbi:RNA polymerase sigma factor, sigma-70 family [Amycolatopsis arida]|uniref:RNA polymerase sigma factor, sigma-70 family n=1 Tax=Amycolatopsis arida TaxID=587909 RepID=A0A1I5WMV0_9PSEU|nr:sigma-70 family RNA polymerase sigma factor [Amycolatopsis arida]TDX92361.1 RNA polymerase sigma factor (sigma-70 family) [Amycolatopsis arida]SFQ21114.1 RNA polymerase sigma factor, sigma-70 family [Amycolatopsis arida]